MRGLKSREWRAAALTGLVLAVVIGGTAWRYRKPIDAYFTWLYQKSLHAATDREGPRRDLARGRFGAGSSLDDLIAAHPPTTLTRGGRYAEALYKTPGSTEYAVVVAKDGRLASVRMNGPDEGDIELFNDLTYPEYIAYLAMLRDLSWSQRKPALMAVVGAAPAVEP